MAESERVFVPHLLTHMKALTRRAMELDPSVNRGDALEATLGIAAMDTSDDLKEWNHETGEFNYSEDEKQVYLKEMLKMAFKPLNGSQIKIHNLIMWDRTNNGR